MGTRTSSQPQRPPLAVGHTVVPHAGSQTTVPISIVTLPEYPMEPVHNKHGMQHVSQGSFQNTHRRKIQTFNKFMGIDIEEETPRMANAVKEATRLVEHVFPTAWSRGVALSFIYYVFKHMDTDYQGYTEKTQVEELTMQKQYRRIVDDLIEFHQQQPRGHDDLDTIDTIHSIHSRIADMGPGFVLPFLSSLQTKDHRIKGMYCHSAGPVRAHFTQSMFL